MGMHDLPIGLATAGDAQAIAIMSRDLVEAGLGWEYRRERIASMIRNRDTVALAARDGPGVAGFAIMTFGEERGHLVLMAVRPTHQRRGVARRLVGWLADSARVAGIVSLHVELRVSNVAALGFYRREGFAEALRVPGYYRGREAAVRMIRVLRDPALRVPAWQPPTLDGRAR
jgi:ribosomal-protein-alanine N-acetyltransferase